VDGAVELQTMCAVGEVVERQDRALPLGEELLEA
jgi:hypothetical protein